MPIRREKSKPQAASAVSEVSSRELWLVSTELNQIKSVRIKSKCLHLHGCNIKLVSFVSFLKMKQAVYSYFYAGTACRYIFPTSICSLVNSFLIMIGTSRMQKAVSKFFPRLVEKFEKNSLLWFYWLRRVYKANDFTEKTDF